MRMELTRMNRDRKHVLWEIWLTFDESKRGLKRVYIWVFDLRAICVESLIHYSFRLGY